jgi:RND family efflux transporter MFP subunit
LRTLCNLRYRTLPLAVVLALTACAKPPAGQAGAPPQAMPVQTLTVTSSPVPRSDEYVATIKSRRSATINAQVDGYITRILVRSGDHVKAGQALMDIDPVKQEATVATQVATERQKQALYEYNQTEVERQRKLFAAGVTSRDTLDQAEQAYKNSKADYESSVSSRITQERQLSYYKIAAPFDGVVGDVPVHVGDYASPTTQLTTVDENADLEAYIFIPTERAGEVKRGLGVDIVDSNENLIEHTTIDFVSPQVDNQLQGVLAKAKIHRSLDLLRNAQIVKAKVIWSISPTPTVPVLAVTRIGGQSFVYLADSQGGKSVAKQRSVDLGDTVGNSYAVKSGLKPGDKVIISGIQFLVDGVPVQPLG